MKRLIATNETVSSWKELETKFGRDTIKKKTADILENIFLPQVSNEYIVKKYLKEHYGKNENDSRLAYVGLDVCEGTCFKNYDYSALGKELIKALNVELDDKKYDNIGSSAFNIVQQDRELSWHVTQRKWEQLREEYPDYFEETLYVDYHGMDREKIQQKNESVAETL